MEGVGCSIEEPKNLLMCPQREVAAVTTDFPASAGSPTSSCRIPGALVTVGPELGHGGSYRNSGFCGNGCREDPGKAV